MKFGFANPRLKPSKPRERGFTFAEILAALVFMAIVIPVTLEGISIANRASVFAERKAEAARLADQILTEKVITGDWQFGGGQERIEETEIPYRWELHSQPWAQANLTELTLVVYFPVQGQEHFVRLTTLVNEEAIETD